ncbi:ectoine/hydroxyectoine ABC transporter permease subunit EhuD [Paraburkholderia aspalathi]|uniref:Amino acid ABC transporter membrane protein 2, PAAT family n=1 Tax=Paraburkholderia aspalathi TaxID=1324617 RepID=A0A1I7BEB1_9BURK|nr:ectoine/hydroxyectoine ABC transporter permease subunit EhuD [Paraburkholderia aspalathi]SFT85504.1 amino acid ABC transporter membrane protein 2, PAAT family [Paraburkholderia aspalathi]
MDVWNWRFALDILPQLIKATGSTVLAAIGGYIIATVIGLIFALVLRSRIRLLTVAVRELVEFLRSTPLILQIFFVFYVGPEIGIRLSPWTSGMIALGAHYAAYLSEVYRGGIESVPKGQWEAAKALNLSTFQTYRRVVLPQALPASLSGMGNYLVGILKDTPMLAVIGVTELLHAASTVGGDTYRYLEPYTLVGLIFLALSLPTAWGCNRLERTVRKMLGLQK